MNSVDDRPIPCPGPMTHGHRRRVRQGGARPGRPVQGLGRTCLLTAPTAEAQRRTSRRPCARDPGLPEAVEIYDTTLRDGSQLEGISLTVDDKLRIAEQLDHLGVHFIEGGWPGANPKDDEFFERVGARAAAASAPRSWPSGPPAGPRARSTTTPTLRNLVEAGTSAVCIVGKCWDYHVTEALRTTLDEGVAMVADSVEFLRRPGPAGALRRRALLRRLQAQPRVRLRVLEAAAEHGAETLVLCDTNGGSLPARGRGDRAGGRRPLRRRRRRSACTSTTTPAAAWPTRWPACAAAPTQVQGTINGYGERTGNCNLTTIIPNLTLKMGVRTLPEGRLGAAHASAAPHRRARQHHAQPAAALRRHVGVRPQGGPARVRHRPPQGRLRARRPRRRRQRHPLRGVRDGRQVDARDEGQGARPRRSTARRSPTSSTSSSASSTRATTSRRPTARSSCSCGGPPAGSRTSSTLESFRVIVEPGRRACRAEHRGHRQGAGRRRADASRSARATARSTPSTPRCGRPSATRYPQLAQVHLTDYKVRVLDTGQGHRRGHPGPHRLDQRRRSPGPPSA